MLETAINRSLKVFFEKQHAENKGSSQHRLRRREYSPMAYADLCVIRVGI